MEFINERMKAAAVELRILDREIASEKNAMERARLHIPVLEEKRTFFLKHYEMLTGMNKDRVHTPATPKPAAEAPISPETAGAPNPAPAAAASTHTPSWVSQPADTDAGVDSAAPNQNKSKRCKK